MTGPSGRDSRWSMTTRPPNCCTRSAAVAHPALSLVEASGPVVGRQHPHDRRVVTRPRTAARAQRRGAHAGARTPATRRQVQGGELSCRRPEVDVAGRAGVAHPDHAPVALGDHHVLASVGEHPLPGRRPARHRQAFEHGLGQQAGIGRPPRGDVHRRRCRGRPPPRASRRVAPAATGDPAISRWSAPSADGRRPARRRPPRPAGPRRAWRSARRGRRSRRCPRRWPGSAPDRPR